VLKVIYIKPVYQLHHTFVIAMFQFSGAMKTPSLS
jgi:hypothetical protein